MQRLRWVDELRGIAILLMVVFHFCYDLRYFGYVDWNVPNGPYWWPFRYLILTLFIFTMGMSLSLAHGHVLRWKKFTIRLGQLVLAAAAITLMSLYVFPNSWIYFGILHFLALASVLGVLLVRTPLMALAAGLLLLLLYWSGVLDNQWPFNYLDVWPPGTEDYVPLFPWLGVTFLGVAAGAIAHRVPGDKLLFWLPRWIGYAGRHGLIIYLVHQPLLFAGFYLVAVAFN